jgi:hypothetical protein
MRIFKNSKISTNRGLVDAFLIPQESNASLRGSMYNIQDNNVQHTVIFTDSKKSPITRDFNDTFLIKIESGTGDNIIVPPDTRFMLSDGSSKPASSITNKDLFKLCLFNSNTGTYEIRISNCMNVQRMPRETDRYTFDPREVNSKIENEVYEFQIDKDSTNFIANGFVITV